MITNSDKNEIYLSSSPHYEVVSDTQKTMLVVILALLPLCIVGVVYFGIPALIRILVSVLSCVGFEYLFRRVTKQASRIKDCSAVITGIMFALILPPTFPVWMTIAGAFFAIVVVKECFGGLGMNVFNPALGGRAFLFISFPLAMGTWVNPFTGAVDAASAATPLAGGADSVLLIDLFLGKHGGTIGETSSLLIILAFILLSVVKIIDWRTPLTMVATTVVFEWIFAGTSGLFTGDPLFSLLSGGLLFGAVFMATDYATTPVTPGGRLIFGFGCGFITWLIRQFGGNPEGVMFSILIMNTFTAFLNRIIPKKYGYVKPKKGGAK